MSYIPYTRHKLGKVARRLKGPRGCRMVMLGDSTAAPGNTPRWSQSIIKGWRLPILGRTNYEHSTGAAAEGLEIFNAPTLSTSPGGTIDGVTVPPGWIAFYQQLAAETGGVNVYRPIISSLDNYALRHPLAGSNVELTVAMLGTPNAMQFAGGSYTGAVTHSYSVGSMGLVSGQWNKVSRGVSTNTIGTGATLQALWNTPFGEEVILGKYFTIGGCEWTCPARLGTPGLIYSSIALGGYSVYDHLPTALGGPGGSLYSDAERAAKFDFWGWPEVITIMLGFNLEADELIAGVLQAVWKTRYEALIEWHRDLYAANGKPAPLFMLINGWDTDGAATYREQQGEVLYEIADAVDDVGVLNLMQIMRDEYGDFDAWEATYLSDGVHQSTAGAEEFGKLSWRELEYASSPGRIAYATGSGDIQGGLTVASHVCNSPGGATILADASITGLISTEADITVTVQVDSVPYNTQTLTKADGQTTLKVNAGFARAELGQLVEFIIEEPDADTVSYVATLVDPYRTDVNAGLEDYTVPTATALTTGFAAVPTAAENATETLAEINADTDLDDKIAEAAATVVPRDKVSVSLAADGADLDLVITASGETITGYTLKGVAITRSSPYTQFTSSASGQSATVLSATVNGQAALAGEDVDVFITVTTTQSGTLPQEKIRWRPQAALLAAIDGVSVSGTVTAEDIADKRTWKFPKSGSSIISTNTIQLAASQAGTATVCFDLNGVLESNVTVASVSTPTVTGTAATIGTPAIHTSKRKVNIPLTSVTATAGRYTVTMTFVATDSEQYVVKGYLQVE